MPWNGAEEIAKLWYNYAASDAAITEGKDAVDNFCPPVRLLLTVKNGASHLLTTQQATSWPMGPGTNPKRVVGLMVQSLLLAS